MVEVEWGNKKNAGDWLFGYYYTYLEALAAHSSYIADDWARWGNANQVRATNLEGSEFRARYTIRPNMNLLRGCSWWTRSTCSNSATRAGKQATGFGSISRCHFEPKSVSQIRNGVHWSRI